MKISRNLPQFNLEKVLIIVTGKQEGEFYSAFQGSIEKVDSFRFQKPVNSDNEIFLSKQGTRGAYQPGTTYNDKKEK